MTTLAPNLAITTAARCLRAGGVIGYPTEAVFGLGCDPLQHHAVQRLLDIKQRSVDKGLLLIAASLEQLLPWINITDEQFRQLKSHWPQGVSYLLDAHANAPTWITGQHKKIGVRVTQHPVARSLCDQFGGAIVSTSANISGRPATRTSIQLRRHLGDILDFIVEGECNLQTKPSTIIDFTSGQVVRS
ncbi:MAG: L-threonylcarbamoyladenylate synthase [Alcanivoracaceae bacterium]|nr:L-threonylcarbamoyladenylate synthase [Alcanivoracaceae bacterium]